MKNIIVELSSCMPLMCINSYYMFTEKEKARKNDTVAGKTHLKALSLIFKHGASADIQKEAERGDENWNQNNPNKMEKPRTMSQTI
jgi:hypothetical protein